MLNLSSSLWTNRILEDEENSSPAHNGRWSFKTHAVNGNLPASTLRGKGGSVSCPTSKI